VLEFAAALSSLSLFKLSPTPSTAPLCSRPLHKLGDLLLNRLVVQTLQRDLGLLSVVCGSTLAALSSVTATGLAALVALARLEGKRTVSCEQSGLKAAGLTNEDGRVRVVLLHRGVAALEKVPGRSSASIPSSLRAHSNILSSQGVVPCRSAVLARLAEQKPQLLQPRIKRVLGGHCVGRTAWWESIALVDTLLCSTDVREPRRSAD
jgi:hypothetical protein